jgi:hypothetical protein
LKQISAGPQALIDAAWPRILKQAASGDTTSEDVQQMFSELGVTDWTGDTWMGLEPGSPQYRAASAARKKYQQLASGYPPGIRGILLRIWDRL